VGAEEPGVTTIDWGVSCGRIVRKARVAPTTTTRRTITIVPQLALLVLLSAFGFGLTLMRA
jgi:hypothetical protein